MKRTLIYCLLAIITCVNVQAQSRAAKRAMESSAICHCAKGVQDTMYYDGVAQLIYARGGDFAYIISDMSGEVVLKIRKVRFTQGGAQSILLTEFMHPEDPDNRAYSAQWLTEYAITKTLSEAKVMVNGKFNQAGWEEYRKFNPSPTGKSLTNVASSTTSNDHAADWDESELKLFLADGEIYQDGQLKGKYTISTEELATTEQTSHKISNSAGKLVAIAKIPKGGGLTVVYLIDTGKEMKFETRSLALLVSNLIAVGIL